MLHWGDLFTGRQKLALTQLCRSIRNLKTEHSYGKEIASLALSRFTDIFNALCQWENTKNQVRHLFTRQALPMLWDFAEPGFFGDQAGDFAVTLGTMVNATKVSPHVGRAGQALTADTSGHPLPDGAAGVWS